MTATTDALAQLIHARAGLYATILELERYDLNPVITALDEAIRQITAQQYRAFDAYCAAN
jgi:hypothetical protein